MTGQDLIDYILRNHLKICEIAFQHESEESPDRCYDGIHAEQEESSIGTIYVF